MGWIFFKPTYDRMNLIEKDDLDRDASEYTYEIDVQVLTLSKLFAGSIEITVGKLHVLLYAHILTKPVSSPCSLDRLRLPDMHGLVMG